MTLIEEHESYRERTKLAVGEVLLKKHEQRRDSLDRPYFRREVRVGDISDSSDEKKRWYRSEGDKGEAWLAANPKAKKTIVRRKTREVIIDPDNYAACHLYYDSQGNPTSMVEWAKDFPDAIALYALQHPDTDGARMLESGTLDDATKEKFTYMLDAIGIRTRAAIYAEILVDLAISVDEPTLNIISVGSGAAVPNIGATRRVEQELGKSIDWSFFDNDPRALSFANTLIDEQGFARSHVDYGPMLLHDDGTWEFEGRSYEEAYTQPDASADVVDALGLFEYLRDETAIDFVKHLYEKVKPGGIMVISNMLKDRPQKAFNKRGVGWPHLFLRSEDDLLTVLSIAGVDTSDVTMTHAEDGIYVVVEIRKPV